MSASTAYTQKSYWLNTYGPYTPNDPLQGDLTVDVAIIGGGYTGLATAHFLKRAEPTLRVAVLEGEVVGDARDVEHSLMVALFLGDQEWLCHWQSHFRCVHRSAIDAM
jgi:hypothetical protein